MSRVIKIDGVQIKNPKEFRVSRFNLTKAGRVSTGKMTMDLIAKKRSFEFVYEIISGKHLKQILDLIYTDKMFFELDYPEADGTRNTVTVYSGAIPSQLYRSDMGEYWKDVSFKLIEQ